MPTRWWLRPVNRHARVGEHTAVVWKFVNRSPRAASRSMFGVERFEPYAPSWAKPRSSSTMTMTFGAPGRNGGPVGALRGLAAMLGGVIGSRTARSSHRTQNDVV